MNVKAFAKRVLPISLIRVLRRYVERSRKNKLMHSLSASQVGQDYWVYGEVFDEKLKGFFLDVGAHDGCYLSNTYLLEKRYQWEGICIEGNPETYLELKGNRACTCIHQCVDNQEGIVEFAIDGVMGGIVSQDCDNSGAKTKTVIQVKTRPLEDILRDADAPKTIDYLSMDIEGAEDRALLGFPFEEYVFNCITIERPSAQLRGLLSHHGYVLIKEIPGLDCFYVHRSFLPEYQKNLFAHGSKKFFTRRWW